MKKDKIIIIILISIIFWLLGLEIISVILFSLTIFLIIKINKKNTNINIKQNEEQDLEIEDTSKLDELRLECDLAREQLNESSKIKMQTDVRQFMNRNDVSREEVLRYMINKDKFVGFIVQQLHLERIMEVCNFNEDDRKWVTHELWGKTKIMPDEENKAIEDYIIKKMKKMSNKQEIDTIKMWNELKELGLDENEAEIAKQEELNSYRVNEDYYDYDKWLKRKGLI